MNNRCITEGSESNDLLDKNVGSMINPCNSPRVTIPKNILKKMRKISEDENPVTSMPRNVLKPEYDDNGWLQTRR